MAGQIPLLCKFLVFRSFILNSQERTGHTAACIAHRLLFEDVIAEILSFALRILLRPVIDGREIREHFFDFCIGKFKISAVDSHLRHRRVICPNAAAVRIKKHNRLRHLGHKVRKHAVQKPQRTVMNREIVKRQAENTERNHRNINRRFGEDKICLGNRRNQHADQNRAVTLRVNSRRRRSSDEENHENHCKDAVANHAVECLSEIRNQAVIIRTVHHYPLRRKRMMQKRI